MTSPRQRLVLGLGLALLVVPKFASAAVYSYVDWTAANVAEARAARITEYREKFANPYVAAERGFIDEVIRPRQTRAKVIAALAAFETKRDRNPPKKHGNIPL